MRRAFLLLALLFTAFPVSSQNLNAEYQRLQAGLLARPDDLGLKMDLAYLFSEGREIGRAIELYEEVIKKDPGSLRAWTELCALQTEVRQGGRAETACLKAVELAPLDPLMADNLGLSYFKFGKFRQSLKPFLAALALNPKATLVRTHVAQAFLALREPLAAKAVYEEILVSSGISDEERALAHYGIFLADKGLKDYDHAFTAILETYKLSANPLYLGKVVTTFMLRYQAAFFFLIGGIVLMASAYLGKRLNRFLKNEV